MTYDDMSQAGWLGARVLHPRAADLARDYQVHLSVRPRLGGLASCTEFVTNKESCARSIVIVHTAEPGCARVSVVGSGLRDTVGGIRLARLALRSAGVPLLAEEWDRTRSMISCVVPGDALQAAAQALHCAFVEGQAVRHPLAASTRLMHVS